jgi:hypothetical protein
MIVECSSDRKSKTRTEPSAPTEAKTSLEPGHQSTSYTSRSWAISCVSAVLVGRSQTVHVVSMEEVTIRFGEGWFQEKEVRGAGGDVDDLD